MGCCSNTNPFNSQDTIDNTTFQAVENLVRLLEASPEYQHYKQLTHKIYSDSGTSSLLRQLQMLQSAYFRPDDDQAANQIQAKLRALPIMQEYYAAEEQVKILFGAVDDIISQAAGLPFAENAVVSGFG